MSALFNRLYPLVKAVLILLLLFLIVAGLYAARSFLIPLAFAAILALLMVPLCQKLETKGLSRPTATLLCVLLLLIFFSVLAVLLSAQITSFVQDFPKFEEQLRSQISKVRQFIQEHLGISPQQAVQGDSSGISNLGSTVFGFLGSFTMMLANSLLMLVYLFMLINYRSHFSRFILKVVPGDQKEKTKGIMKDSSSIARRYILGRGFLIVILGIMYSAGLLLVGIEHAILFSVLAALISIIPYVGNIIGVLFPLFMAVAQGGGLWMLLGIVLVFSIAQFVESYILEPYVVGAEVNIHPFFTIAMIIAGEMIWGISGMILAIPLLGILKITMENIEPLKPYAFLIGDSDESNRFSKTRNRLKRWFE